MFLGSAGTGGSPAVRDCPRWWLDPLLPGRWGLGVRKVRSVIEPLLPRRRRPPGPPGWSGAGPVEATEALRRFVRFV